MDIIDTRKMSANGICVAHLYTHFIRAVMEAETKHHELPTDLSERANMALWTTASGHSGEKPLVRFVAPVREPSKSMAENSVLLNT
jgi:hypothetical protein